MGSLDGQYQQVRAAEATVLRTSGKSWVSTDSVSHRESHQSFRAVVTHSFLLKKKKIIVVELQCCVNFCCTAKCLRWYIYTLFPILFHYGLSHDIEYSLPCCTAGPCRWPIQYITVCICWSQTPSTSVPAPTFGDHKRALYISESISVLYICSFVSYFRFRRRAMVFVFLFMT